MEHFVTIHTCSIPQDAYMIKALLESYEIDVFLKDELTIQANNLLSPALNGVKIQVHPLKAPDAILILEEHGYIHPDLEEHKDFWEKTSSWLSKIPLINHLHPLVFWILILVLIFAAIFFRLKIEGLTGL